MHKDRALLVSLGVLLLAFAAYQLRLSGPGVSWMPGCALRGLTGLECPGCGMTRGTYALLHGRFLEALRFNPVGMILLPIALVGMGLEVLGWVRGRPLRVRMRVGKRGAWLLFFLIVGFGVGRNLI